MSKVSISFSVPPKRWEDFSNRASALFLNRGPFLDHMLSIELPYLQEDLKGLKLSLRAKRSISGELKKLVPLSPNVNFEVREETAELLRGAVKEHNLVRDAFFCRLLVFLACSDKLLDYLEVSHYATDPELRALVDEMPLSPLKTMEAVQANPLSYLRDHVQHIHGCGLYRVGLPTTLACYIEDEYVAGTRAQKRMAKLFESL